MKIDQKILDRFDELIEMGKTVYDSYQHHPPHQPGGRVVVVSHGHWTRNSQLAMQWTVSVLTLIATVLGKENDFYTSFKVSSDEISKFSESRGVVAKAQGILVAAKDTYENGYLFNIQQRITADVFSDFLEQAEYLLDGGYHGPAAVTAGCVLEDGLRKMCDKEGITFPAGKKPTLSVYNQELAKKGIYSTMTLHQVNALAALRNDAAHGDWNKFTNDDVKKMIVDVRDFMVKYFT